MFQPTKSLVMLMIWCTAVPYPLFADFQYHEKTQITGGAAVSMMKLAGALSSQARHATDPVISTVFVKGNRMAHVNDQSTEIVDLDRETVTNIDHTKKQYTVITFEQMRQQFEEMSRKAKEEQAKAQQEQKATPAPAKDNTEMNFDVKVRNTNASKDVAGLSAKEAILTMVMQARDKSTGETGAMAMTNDMWMVPEVPGYNEVRDFQVRYAKKLGTVIGGSVNRAMSPQLFAAHPGMGKGMAQMVAEMSKLKGVPVLQVMRIGSSANGEPLAAASEAPLPASPEMPTAGTVATKVANSAAQTAANDVEQAATAKLASKMGTFGNVASSLHGLSGFGHKKKQPPADTSNPAAAAPAATAATATPAAPASATAGGPSVLIESSTEVTSFSSAALDASHFAVPAGYQQVAIEKQQQ